MKKRILSVLLSLTLILSSGFPVAGAAAAGSISPDHAPVQDTDGQEEPAAPSAPVPANDPSGETAYYYVYTPDGDWVYIGRGALNNVGPAADAESSSKQPVKPGMVDAPEPDTKETHGSVEYTTYPNITYDGKPYAYKDSSAVGVASPTYTIEWFTYSSINGYDISGTDYSDGSACWHVDGMLRFSDTPAVTFQVKQPGDENFEYVKDGDLPKTQYVEAGSSFSDLERPSMPAKKTEGEITYVFSGWYYLDGDGEKILVGDDTAVTSDMVLYGEYVTKEEREYGTLTFDMYYLVASQYPDPLDKDSPPGNYGPHGNNVPMISLEIDVDALIAYLCQKYNVEDVVGEYPSNGQNYWSITPTSCGLPAPNEDGWSQECYDKWWGDILDFLKSQGSNFEDQLEQIGMGRDNYTGYVLKEQSSRSSFHIDGILRVQPVAYITEYYIDRDFKYLDAAHAEEGDAEADYKSTYGEIRAQYEKLIAKDLGVSKEAISFDWANSTFQVGDTHYVMQQESIAHDTGNRDTLMQTENDQTPAVYTPSTDKQVYRAAFNLSYTSVTDAGLSIGKELIKAERDGASLEEEELSDYSADIGDVLTYQLTVTGHGVDSVTVKDTLSSSIPQITIPINDEDVGTNSGWDIQGNGNGFTATYTYTHTVNDTDIAGGSSSLHNVATAVATIPGGGTITDQDEYDVPLAGRTIRVTPADITIYVGGEGYEAVVDDEGTISKNSMPRPLFHVTLPAGLSADDVVIKGTSTDGAVRTWTLHHAGKTAESADLYYIEAPEGQTPVRVQFTDGSSVTVSDDFNPLEEESLHTKYTIELFTNGVTNITAESKDTQYAVDAVGSGTLTIRAVDDDQDPVVPAESELENPVEAGSGAVVASGDTTYTLNDTTVPAEDGGLGVGLLFDGIIDDAEHNRTGALLKQLKEKHGVSTKEGYYQAQYLDLVDSHNGNAWVTASESVDVYWGYPEGTGQDTEFTLYHFKGLHREGTNDGFDLEDVGTSEIETVELVNTEHGIQFSIDKGGFSPFVLVWSDNSGGTDIPDPGPDPDPDTPPDGPDEPDEPDVPDTPDEPDVPDTPDEPDVPDTPDEPDEPDTPDEPDVPDTPDEPDVPDTPDEPDVPDTPDEPDVPDTPDEPDVPDTPDEPDVPDTPDEPDVPDTPDTPDDPGQPDDTPKTGDTANPILWMTLLLVSGAGIAAALLILNTRLYRGKHLK